MLDAQTSREILDELLGLLDTEQAEAVLEGGRLSQVTVRDRDVVDHRTVTVLRLTARAARKTSEGWQQARASTTRVDRVGAELVAKRALRALDVAPADPGFVAMPHPDDLGSYPAVEGVDEGTAASGPAHRVDALADVAFAAGRAGLGLDGRYVVTLGGVGFDGALRAFAVSNRNGVFAHHVGNAVQWAARLRDGQADGWGDLHLIEGVRRGQVEAIDWVDAMAPVLTTAAQLPRMAAAEALTVALDRPAVAALLGPVRDALSGALALAGDSPWLAGDAPLGPQCALRVDAGHPELQSRPFDVEGIPSVAFDLVRNGTPVDTVRSARTARASGQSATGHCVDAATGADLPNSLVMAGGDGEIGTLVAQRSRTLVVRRLELRPVGGAVFDLLASDGGVLFDQGAAVGLVAPFVAPAVDLRRVFGAIESLGTPRRVLDAVVPPLVLNAPWEFGP